MSGRIYCGRLSSDATEKNLETLLKSIGKIRDIDFKEGYAYAVFKDYRDADKAVQELNGKDFMGQSILVERAKDIRNCVGGYTIAGGYTARVRQPKPPPVRTNHRIRVENLPARAKWSELKEFMSVAGEVTFADTHRRRPGEGLVEFANKEDMMNALETLDKQEFLGRKIRLVEETPRSNKDRSLSRSRSRSTSSSRKRKRHSSSPSLSQSKGRRSRSRDRSTSHERSRKKRAHSSSPSRSSRRRSRSSSEKNHKSSSHSRRKRSHSRSPKRSRRNTRSRSHSKSKSQSDRHSSSKSKSHKKKKKRTSRSHSQSRSPKKRRS